jgi:hypothetical protein
MGKVKLADIQLPARLRLAAGDHMAATQAPCRNWRWLRHHYLPGWWPTAETIGLYNPSGVKIRYYRYRGSKIPTPWEQPDWEHRQPDHERLEALIAR